MKLCSAGGRRSPGRAQKTYSVGHRMTLTISSTIRPPTITIAKGRCESEPISWDMAAGTLLAPGSRRQRLLCLTAMCASPLAGAALAGILPLPGTARPVLLAVAAGVLGQVAWVSLAAAFHRVRPAWRARRPAGSRVWP